MSTRFRPLTPEGERSKDDEILIDLERFEAELAASIARLDGKPRNSAALPPRDVDSNEPLSRFPPLDLAQTATPLATIPPPVSTLPIAVAATPIVTATAPALASPLDLLSELRLAAEAKLAEDNAQDIQIKARIARTDRAMRRLFGYLGEFAGHLNKIRPALPQSFRPLANVELTGLHWTESFLDYRTDGGTEISPLDSISLRYKLGASDSVRVAKLPNHAPAYLEELKRIGLSYTTSDQRGTKGLIEQVNIAIERAITVTLLFKANTDGECVHLRSRNFSGLGHTNYTLLAADIDQTLLDELGKHILGRPNQLFARLRKE